ncbi:MAG: riboflavin biosynthesis protein RibF [Planctomycetota bacterium]
MRVVEGLDNLLALDLVALYGEARESHSAVTVGVFDGVHLGHLRLVHELLEMASRLDAVPTAITFRSHPDTLLRGRAPPELVSVPHRLRLLRRAGVQRLVLLDFDERLRSMTADAFARRILAERLRCRGLLLGFDSHLGRDREGTPARFATLGQQLGFEVRASEALAIDGRPVSSTAIREAIQRGDLQLSSRLLGRYPSAFGVVEQGDRRGRQLGFPTANLVPQSSVLPPLGVYAVHVIHDGETYAGVANHGRRPTFAGEDGPTVLEVHLLDFEGDLYGATLEVSFVAALRGEQTFASAEALRTQIAKDVARARAMLQEA